MLEIPQGHRLIQKSIVSWSFTIFCAEKTWIKYRNDYTDYTYLTELK
jgi:hypothetical protein